MESLRQAIALSLGDRWQVYRRLQELEIACWCESCHLLVVQVGGVGEMIQVWCVLQQVMGSRKDAIAWLEKCWQK